MGEVYRARDNRLGRFVAVKVLPAEVASDPDRRKRFELEARAVAALSHPNICTVFDVGREDGPGGPVDYLVMELLEGETLAQRLRRGPMPTDQLLAAGIQIASALEQAHRAGVVHRDVKPGNILLAKAGAKLLDFGLARLRPTEAPSDAGSTAATQERAPVDALTDAGHVVGTYPYMAP
jgi:serine/threonine protein kinase